MPDSFLFPKIFLFFLPEKESGNRKKGKKSTKDLTASPTFVYSINVRIIVSDLYSF